MKRIALVAVALSMLAAPAANAGAMNFTKQHSAGAQTDVISIAQKDVAKKRVVVKERRTGDRYVTKKKVVQKQWYGAPHWKRGERYSAWKRHQEVRDWRRYGLHRPGRGQEWIRVGNDYLLVGILSGVIAGIVAGH